MGYEAHTKNVLTSHDEKSWYAYAHLYLLPVAQSHTGCSFHHSIRPPEPLQPNVIQGRDNDYSLTVVVIASHKLSEGAR